MSREWAVRGPLSRLGDTLQKPPFPSLSLAVIVIALLIIISLVLDQDGGARVLQSLNWSHVRATISFLLVFLAGGATGLLLFGMAQSGWKESASCFWVSVKQTGILLGIIGFALLAFFIWIASAWTNSANKQHFLNQHDPGGIFAAFMGIVTIVGFAFTLHDLREMRRRITTFPDLIERLTAMLQKAKGDEVVRFLAYTPALGYIALDDKEFNNFYRALHSLDSKNRPPIAMTCLSPKDLKDWHNLFIGRMTRRKRFEDTPVGGGGSTRKPEKAGVVDPDLASAATRMSEHIVRYVADEIATSSDKEPRVKRLPFEFLPGYYFFVSSDRAIVAAPLQLPFPKGAPKRGQQSRGTVQMLGFETNDRAIIRDLTDLYEGFKELPSSYIAEYSEDMPAESFEDWCKNPSHCQSAIQTLLTEYAVAKGPLADGATVEESRRFQDYGKYLTDDKLKDTKLEVIFRVSLKEEAPDRFHK
jgi:hypothetical protein